MRTSASCILKPAAVFDAHRGEFIPGRAVQVRDGRIQAVEPPEAFLAAGPDVPPSIDLAGHVLLPGLINTHVHLTFSAGDDPLRDYLAEDSAQHGAILAPRLVLCGPPITPTAGQRSPETVLRPGGAGRHRRRGGAAVPAHRCPRAGHRIHPAGRPGRLPKPGALRLLPAHGPGLAGACPHGPRGVSRSCDMWTGS